MGTSLSKRIGRALWGAEVYDREFLSPSALSWRSRRRAANSLALLAVLLAFAEAALVGIGAGDHFAVSKRLVGVLAALGVALGGLSGAALIPRARRHATE